MWFSTLTNLTIIKVDQAKIKIGFEPGLTKIIIVFFKKSTYAWVSWIFAMANDAARYLMHMWPRYLSQLSLRLQSGRSGEENWHSSSTRGCGWVWSLLAAWRTSVGVNHNCTTKEGIIIIIIIYNIHWLKWCLHRVTALYKNMIGNNWQH